MTDLCDKARTELNRKTVIFRRRTDSTAESVFRDTHSHWHRLRRVPSLRVADDPLEASGDVVLDAITGHVPKGAREGVYPETQRSTPHQGRPCVLFL